MQHKIQVYAISPLIWSHLSKMPLAQRAINYNLPDKECYPRLLF